MSRFSSRVEDYWRAAYAGGRTHWRGPSLTANVDADLDPRFLATLLDTDAGARAALSPALAAALVWPHDAALDAAGLRRALADAGASLWGADCVFYFAADRHDELARETPAAHVRRLGADDAAAFARFEAEACEQDRDDAYVGLDHAAAFGAFVDGRLVCAASMYQWNGSPLMDLGVLTLGDQRGRGHARAVVRTIAGHAVRHGHEPQYRCQLDNAASVALAAAAGWSSYGQWDFVPAPPRD